jgi:actin-related protein
MVRPLIIDLGTGFLKYGFPGLRYPKVLRASYKTQNGNSGDPYLHKLDPNRKGFTFPLENGALPDSGALQPLLAKIFDRLNLTDQKLAKTDVQLLVFATVPQNQVYETCDELKKVLQCRKMLAAYQQVLTLLLLSKHSGIVVDIGYTISLIAPIYQGFLIRDQVISTATGSFLISAAIRQSLTESAKKASERDAPIYRKLAGDEKAIEHIKRTLCQVLPVFKRKPESPKKKRYRYNNLDFELDSIIWQATEVLFDPKHIGIGDIGLVDAIVQVLEGSDATIRKALANDIILTGGGSMFPGLCHRFETQLRQRFSHLPINVYDLENPFACTWQSAAKLFSNQ